jgi:hypothetical protein
MAVSRNRAKDKMHGEVTGQNVGKIWFMIDADKFPPKM